MKIANSIRVMILASGDLWAGAEVMLYQLISGLFASAPVDLMIVLLNRGKLAEELESLGVNIRVFDESKIPFVKIMAHIRKLIKDFNPNIIHSHRYKENILSWCASCGFSNYKLIATQHGMPEAIGNLSRKDKLRNAIQFWLLSAGFSRTVVVSKEMQLFLVGRYGFSERDITVIHNGIRVPKRVIAKPKPRMVVGSAGRLFPVKDFSLLVEVARRVVEQNKSIDFALAGDGPELTMLKEKVRRYDIEGHFRFLGHQEDMTSFYEGLNVYINTSMHEGIPMSVLEAMSHGLPVVAPKVGGFPEIIDDEVSGYLVSGRDPDMFARHILHLFDAEQREKIGRAARERVIFSFSQDVMVRRYVQLYVELDGSGSRSHWEF